MVATALISTWLDILALEILGLDILALDILGLGILGRIVAHAYPPKEVSYSSRLHALIMVIMNKCPALSMCG